MRVWHSYGSEHSMDLVLIGKFETIGDAKTATDRMASLQSLAEAGWNEEDWRSQTERMPDAIIDELIKLELFEIRRIDLDHFVFEHSVEREGSTVRIETEESEVQGFLKVLLHFGARVEVFSRHNWSEDDARPTDTGT